LPFRTGTAAARRRRPRRALARPRSTETVLSSRPAAAAGTARRTAPAGSGARARCPRRSRRAPRARPPAPAGPSASGKQLAQHEREDPAVPDVLALARRVEPDARAELLVVRAHRHLARLAVLDTGD